MNGWVCVFQIWWQVFVGWDRNYLQPDLLLFLTSAPGSKLEAVAIPQIGTHSNLLPTMTLQL